MKDPRRHPREPATCAHCGAAFMALSSQVRIGAGRFCTIQCFGAHAKATGAQAGANNPRWLGGVSNDNMRYKRRTEARYPERAAARKKVRNAIIAGRLARQPCEACGTEPAQAHHSDYSKPLDVRWLCRPCHDAEHAKERAG